MSPSHWFSKNYNEASSRFREQISNLKILGHNVVHEQLKLDHCGPFSEQLIIDIAIVGSIKSEKIFLYTSGIHGVEGFAGSAIQLSVLDLISNETPFDTHSIIFIHIINPYGMAWLRRVNENNVDLNRNFLNVKSEFHGEPDGYEKINNFLNPSKTPNEYDVSFYFKGAFYLAKYGFRNFR